MQIEVSTGNQIEGSQEFLAQVEGTVTDGLSRFSDRITRVIVHFGDENSPTKQGDNDKRCSVEVRLAGLQPIAVTGNGDITEQALSNAMDKIVKTLGRTLERLNDPKGRTPYGGRPEDLEEPAEATEE